MLPAMVPLPHVPPVAVAAATMVVTVILVVLSSSSSSPSTWYILCTGAVYPGLVNLFLKSNELRIRLMDEGLEGWVGLDH